MSTFYYGEYMNSGDSAGTLGKGQVVGLTRDDECCGYQKNYTRIS